MNGGVSVVICCHNSAKRLPETLAHLAAQKVSPEIPWEIVLIDNASTDDTAATAVRCWPNPPPAPIRVVSEPEAGLSHARIRGIREARYPIISFIDDDNWASTSWIQQVNTIFEARPETGAAGGRIEAVCETIAPKWFEKLAGYYAVGRQHLESGDVTNSTGTLLCGAGLSLRTEAARKLLEDGFVFLMSGRKQNRLLTGEDSELCFALRASGWRFWYDDNLVLRHFIPKKRLQWDYVVRLMRGVGESSALFALYLGALSAPPYVGYPLWKRTWLFQTLKAAQQLGSLVLTHPGTCFQSTEDSFATLEFEELKSRLSATWALRDRYRKLQEDIRTSAWARLGKPL